MQVEVLLLQIRLVQHGVATPPPQAVPCPPQATHVVELISQVRPLLHARSAQHGCPVPPHATQVAVFVSQMAPLPQLVPPQQGWPADPHAVQTKLPDHEAQVSPLQQLKGALEHDWPAAMQVTHVLLPDASHARPPQQTPLPKPHCAPAPPQATQRPLNESHTRPLLHVEPLQHGWPAAPHAVHVPVMPEPEPEQVSPLQQEAPPCPPHD